MIALRASYELCLATPSYDALSGSWELHGQSYHNDAKHLITFAKQNHNSKLFLSRPIYILDVLWYNYFG